MQKSIFIILGLSCHIMASMASNAPVRGVVKEKENPEAPIVGANIYWAGTSLGTVSDADGAFEIAPAGTKLVVSFVGFKNDTLEIAGTAQNLLVLLSKNIELEEVLVQERRKGVYYSKLDPIQGQKLTTSELQKAACCNLSESFETNASVDVAYSDAVTGAKQIQMLGLSGNYVQTINENMPSVRGMASSYGLGYIPGPWMESIQISKGTSSVINGYEAITGQINVEFKKPEGDERFHFNFYGNEAIKSEANLNGSIKFSDSLSTMILLHAENHTKDVDDNGDGFLDMPHTKQINFINRWNYKGKSGGHKMLLFKVLDESRQAGQVGAFSSGNNNLYGIDIATRRYEVLAKNGIIFNKPGTSLGIQLSASYHDQAATYGLKTYEGSQFNEYLNVIYQSDFGTDRHKYKTGVSYMGDQYRETLQGKASNLTEHVPGAFFEYTYEQHNKLTILTGLRGDFSSNYGAFFTPRVHVKYHINDWLIWRGSAGKGYRTAIPLAESNYLLASSRSILIDAGLKQEEALNMGTNLSAHIPVGDKELTVMLDYYRTNFQQQVIRDLDSDVHLVHFTNLSGTSYSNAAQIELSYELFHRFTVNAAYRTNDAKQSIDGMLRAIPLTSRYKGLVSLSYATPLKKWQFDFTSQFNGGGRMPDPDVDNPLWNKTFSSYTIFNAQITKNYKKWSFYLGGENLGNFAMSIPIIAAHDPWGENFDGSMIWGPVHGRNIYFGIRYTIREYN